MAFYHLLWRLYTGVYRKIRTRVPLKERGRPYHRRRYTGPFAQGLWGTIERAFSYSKGDGPRSQLNRRAQEEAARVGICQVPTLREDSCTVVLEHWTVARLAQLRRAHDRDRPRSERKPVIVLQVGPHALLLDGHTRVNKWSKKLEGSPRPVIVITPVSPEICEIERI